MTLHLRSSVLLSALVLSSIPLTAQAQSSASFRPPAIPLIVRSPYVSLWQPASTLPGTWPTFWTGAIKAFSCIANIDGKPYRVMGAANVDGITFTDMQQTSLKVTATQSEFTLEGGGVRIHVNFLSPVNPDDLKRQSIPFGYVFASVQSADGSAHNVHLSFDISGEWAATTLTHKIVWNNQTIDSSKNQIDAFTVQRANPDLLSEDSDYPAWGKAVFATAKQNNLTYQSGPDTEVRTLEADGTPLGDSNDPNMPRAVNDHWPVFAYEFNLGTVKSHTKPVELVLGDVRDPAVSYLGKPLPPLWKSYFPSWKSMVAFTYNDAKIALKNSNKLDRQITKDADAVGGPKYAALCDLALRQAYGGTELVGTAKKPWLFLKEISSDGNVSTVDVCYPAYPVFTYTNARMLRLMLSPLLDYAEHGGWPKKFAEHDIGSSYPNASGHNDGREEDMPVEESANMLIMFDSAMQHLSHTDAKEYARKHYDIMKQWAMYEVQNGLKPAFQNQTDDFTGFIKNSANLALKAIVGVGAMGQIAKTAGNTADADYFSKTAKTMIAQWVDLAKSPTGDHLMLAYDQPDTWSLKYNAFPDKALGLNLIPKSVLMMEAKWYLAHNDTYGIPLDNRHSYTKSDWEMFTAASTPDMALKQTIVNDEYRFVNFTPQRVAFTDWYDCLTGHQVGFVARPVIGGIFALLASNGYADRTANLK